VTTSRRGFRARLRSSAGASLLVAGGVLAACTDESPASVPSGGDASATGETPTEAGSVPAPASGTAVTFVANAWADNWFAMYADGTLVGEDTVPITTERSFNSETFTFQAAYPLTLAFVLKDYKENDSGLEYIGKPNQQMGDGGFVFQLREKDTGKLVSVSSSSFRCLVVHKAPLDPSCAKDSDPSATCRSAITPEPPGFEGASFDDSAWPRATEHDAAAVGPKEGYFDVQWDTSAKFIWSEDLFADNTVLCRTKVEKP
jgi:hypothetical protein